MRDIWEASAWLTGWWLLGGSWLAGWLTGSCSLAGRLTWAGWVTCWMAAWLADRLAGSNSLEESLNHNRNCRVSAI